MAIVTPLASPSDAASDSKVPDQSSFEIAETTPTTISDSQAELRPRTAGRGLEAVDRANRLHPGQNTGIFL